VEEVAAIIWFGFEDFFEGFFEFWEEGWSLTFCPDEARGLEGGAKGDFCESEGI